MFNASPKTKKHEKTTPKKRVPRKITPTYLNNAGLYYLERFSSSSENFRRVLMRKVALSCQHHETDPSEAHEWIQDVIDRFQRSGLLDDRAYAEARTKAFHNRGNSQKFIRMKLMSKGVASSIIDEALAYLLRETKNPERLAAIKLAKRRRLGPFRLAEQRPEKREKDMAAIARAGFGYQTATDIIDSENAEELLEELAEFDI